MRSVGAPRALCGAGHRSVLQTAFLWRQGTFELLLRLFLRVCVACGAGMLGIAQRSAAHSRGAKLATLQL